MNFLINALITNVFGVFLVMVLVVVLVMSLSQRGWESKNCLSALMFTIESKTLWKTPGSSIKTGGWWTTIWWEA
jgi:hypothetical protein